MKPDWKDAPEWANWLAMDEDGTWFWYKDRPHKEEECWSSVSELWDTATMVSFNWQNSLEQRPNSP